MLSLIKDVHKQINLNLLKNYSKKKIKHRGHPDQGWLKYHKNCIMMHAKEKNEWIPKSNRNKTKRGANWYSHINVWIKIFPNDYLMKQKKKKRD